MRTKKNVTHRITWMPRLCIPTKDVASYDKLRWAARQALWTGDLRMGKPLGSYVPRPNLTFGFDERKELTMDNWQWTTMEGVQILNSCCVVNCSLSVVHCPADWIFSARSSKAGVRLGGRSVNWNISRNRGKEIIWDSLSSGERAGNSPNPPSLFAHWRSQKVYGGQALFY